MSTPTATPHRSVPNNQTQVVRSQTLAIDTSVGGFGDVWMRLHGLYALAALRPKLELTIRVAPALANVAHSVFGSRLTFSQRPLSNALTFTHLGIRHLAVEILKGRRFVNPFHRTNAASDRWSDRINRAAFSTLAAGGRVFLNDDRFAESYAGWMQVSDLRTAREIEHGRVLDQFRRDFPELRDRLRALVPERPHSGTVIFPSGSSFQIMPPALAGSAFPDAVYAFHESDRYQEAFRRAGLRLMTFSDPLSLVRLASTAELVLCTDSFPSHILQTYSKRTVIALSHYPRSRIVHPSFDGTVLDSAAACCPCITRARAPNGLCPAGKPFCITWDDAGYLARLRDSRNGSVATRSQRQR